jgi:uncharacterized protein YjbI with pentapeptide repeats
MSVEQERTKEIWSRLCAGGAVDDLGLERTGGRIDLRGIVTPPRQTPSKEFTTDLALSGVTWRGLDFSNARIGSITLRDCVIEDCVFDGAWCRHLGIWATEVIGSTFRKADLRAASLGGVEGGKRNTFREVDFSGATLLDTAFEAANFTRCTFANAKHRKVDFAGSVFVDCVFEGVLEETTFFKNGRSEPKSPPNEMKGADFRRAELRSVMFYGMDLGDVKWPEGGDHVVLHDYVATLDKAIAALGASPEPRVRALAAYLGTYRKAAGPNQRTGVIHAGDVAKLAGKEAAAELLRTIESVTGKAR